MRKCAAALVATMALALSLIACGSGDDDSSSSDSGLTKVRAAVYPTFAMLPSRIAEVKGIFEKNGLDVTQQDGTDITGWFASLGKQYDFVPTTASVLIPGAQKGIKNVVFSGYAGDAVGHENQVLVTRPGDTINNYADLAGKTIATVAIVTPQIDAIKYLVSEAGEDPDSIKFVQLGPDQFGDQLKAKRIDAAVALVPFVDTLRDQGFTIGPMVVLDAFSKMQGKALDFVPTGMYAATAGMAEKKPEVLTAWRASLDEAISWILANQDEARQILKDWIKISDDVATQATLPEYSTQFTVTDLQGYADLAERGGQVKGELPDLNQLVWQPRS